MPGRSTWTNAFIRKMIEVAKKEELHISVNDGEDEIQCKTFRKIADVIDSVDDSTIYLATGPIEHQHDSEGFDYRGWFMFTLYNEGEEQLRDYSSNTFSDHLVESIKLTGDE